MENKLGLHVCPKHKINKHDVVYAYVEIWSNFQIVKKVFEL